MLNIMQISLADLSLALRSGDLDLSTYINTVLEHVNEQEGSIHALYPEPDRAERLHRQAQELKHWLPEPEQRPPLFGVLVGVKDLYNVDGLPTRAGSSLPAEEFAGPQAALISALRRSGALFLGKTVSTEFAYFTPGPTRNPLAPEHTPGGSSSGSAAAVAAGYCPLALGTQTIASIIRPASFCGVVGFKPSRTRISLQGIFPFSQSADHAGFITRTLDDLNYLAPYVFQAWKESKEPGKPCIGVATGEYLAQADADSRKNFESVVTKLKQDYFTVEEVDLFPNITALNTEHRRLIAAEFALNHAHLFTRYGHLYSPESTELYKAGSQIEELELIAMRHRQKERRKAIESLMLDSGVDIWISPSTTSTAPRGLQSTGSPLMSLPWTHAGMPSLTMPSGFDANGLPFGLQIMGAWKEDEYVLDAAGKIAQVLLDRDN